MSRQKSFVKLDKVLKEIATRWGIPGMAVGVVEAGEIIYAGGFGVQSLETNAPITTDSIFCVASIAKCFVANAILQLVEQGQLDLDGTICQYLPYFRLDDERYRQITLRQMLSHTSGMPDMDENEYDELVANPEYDEGAAERYVRGLSNRKMVAAPGERFAYSNIAYNVLGDLISKISGQIFENYMKENILRPSGMPESTFYFPEVPCERLAVPHLRTPGMIVNPLYPYHRADSPSSFLHTTVIEMCHWSITNLNRGVFQNKRILKSSSYDQMWTPIAKRGVPPWRETMGLGWSLGHFEDRQVVGHGGGGFGWTCMLTLFPENNQAVIVLCNEQSSAHELALNASIHAMFGKEPQVGTLSWMIPITEAMEKGGIRAAYDCYENIRDGKDYFFDEYELISLFYQLMSAKKVDLAEQVLELNLHAYPENSGLKLFMAKNYIHNNKPERAETLLREVLEINPDNLSAKDMLSKIQPGAATEP
jgi:CubicO group peptidase (beta-lactamase class C family)